MFKFGIVMFKVGWRWWPPSSAEAWYDFCMSTCSSSAFTTFQDAFEFGMLQVWHTDMRKFITYSSFVMTSFEFRNAFRFEKALLEFGMTTCSGSA